VNARIAAALLALMTSTGCIFLPYGGGGGGTGGGSGGSGGSVPGDLTLTWTFNGRSCATAGVSTVRVVVDGETLQNDGVYSCLTDNYPGIRLNDFRARTYTFSIVGYNALNEATYETAGTFTINGDISLNVDLDPVVQSSSYAYLQWTFPPNSASSNPTCSQAGVTNVYVSIDGAAQYSVTCSTGQTTTGSQTSALTIGTHTIDLTAVDSSGYVYYSRSATFTVTATPSKTVFDLDWAVGGAAVAWTLVDGGISRTCAQAGITNVTVNFQDTSTGALLYGSSGDSQPCSAGSVVYDFLTPGTYKVIIEGYGTGGSRYTSNTTAGAPTITIQAGVFKTPSDAVNAVTYRVN
jgi:hypothetical protein